MRTPPSIPTLTALAVAGALVLVGCSEPDDEPGPDGTRGIDARSYYDDYETQVDYDLAMPSTGGSVADEGGTSVPIPGPTEDNTFVDAGTSGFVDPRQDRLSTFALDVDTGSYGVAREPARPGLRPPPASVRVEEWVNAMEYDDPAPTDADLGVLAESGPAPGLDDGTQLVRVAVSAREVRLTERPRVNVTLVVDRSGSMDIRNRLGLVQSSLALLADRLAGDDTVSVVSFEDQARPILEPTPVKDTGKILNAIEELEPGGSTNLEAGLRLGYEQAREGFDDDAVNLVVLASDGVANVGDTGPGSITEKIAEEGRDGIHLVTVGYGMGNYNDHLMEQLADLGDGFYSYVDTYREAEQLFGDGADHDTHPGRRRGADPGGVRPGAGHVVPPGRLRQPRDRRRGLRGPLRRRGRARCRSPRDRVVRGAARRRGRARHADRSGHGEVGRRCATGAVT